MKPYWQGPALRVTQPIGTFWVAAIPASILLPTVNPDPLRLLIDPGSERAPSSRTDEKGWPVGRLAGNQRPLEERRQKEIAEYIDTIEATFPNSIILAATSAGAEGDVPGWTIEARKGQADLLTIPTAEQAAWVVDGQHRLYAFLKTQLADRKDFPLICSVFFDLPEPMQAMIFATINTNQKQVRRGLAMNMYGYNVEDEPRDRWSPEKLGVFMARRLNFDPESALHNRVKVEAKSAPTPELIPGAARAVPTAAVVDGIVGLLSAAPKRDRTTLRSSRFLSRKSRADLEDDGTPLRGWFKRSADEDTYLLVRAFVAQVDQAFWSDDAPAYSMLKRAVGVRALLDFCGSLVAAELPLPASVPLPRSTRDELLKRWGGIVAKALEAADDVDFSSAFFEASGRGQTRIHNVLRLRNGLVNVEQLAEADRSEYSRLKRRK